MARPLPGHIVLLFCDWLSKSKYFLVAGLDDKHGEESPFLLFISTDKLKLALSNPAIDSDFLRIKRSEYTFLDHDSWLDCGDVCQKFNWQTIEYQFQQCVGKPCGKILLSTRDEIVKRVGNSERLSTRQQLIISEALSMLLR